MYDKTVLAVEKLSHKQLINSILCMIMRDDRRFICLKMIAADRNRK